ncbi:hypothetical protein GCM10010840_33140 [Deinococcus aerolatus]|uniref:Uncharacterized protein n=1 Tax=Deinococcus aerolatus TaxID=522487 RepID=A0ABQ2GFI1_9DEIO|nr:hypothetical protein GCM10010840_33140 [Deinococcus aerolatus]
MSNTATVTGGVFEVLVLFAASGFRASGNSAQACGMPITLRFHCWGYRGSLGRYTLGSAGLVGGVTGSRGGAGGGRGGDVGAISGGGSVGGV